MWGKGWCRMGKWRSWAVVPSQGLSPPVDIAPELIWWGWMVVVTAWWSGHELGQTALFCLGNSWRGRTVLSIWGKAFIMSWTEIWVAQYSIPVSSPVLLRSMLPVGSGRHSPRNLVRGKESGAHYRPCPCRWSLGLTGTFSLPPQ